MEYTKQPIDFPKQLELLKEHGLIVTNEVDALKQLGIISYFRLAISMALRKYWSPPITSTSSCSFV
jgi:abortive infection bacteriophage resistance protein